MGDTLEIVPYDSDWPLAFETERRRIAEALGDLAIRIDHNGSTSVPGLAAKPVIDIQISVEQLQPLSAFGRGLESLGYAHRRHADDDFAPFFHRPASWPHTHHVHVVASGGNEERRTLAFRDYLRDHAEAREAYERLKRQLAPQFSATAPGQRQAYSDAKGGFIEAVIARAIAAGYPKDL
jgi:GrpB-like predicted nucleotidyltransferase (UPF0157 family)